MICEFHSIFKASELITESFCGIPYKADYQKLCCHSPMMHASD